MKILILLLLPILSFAQKKGDNTIELRHQSIAKIKNVLFQNGYTLTGNDSMYLVTNPKNIKFSEIKLLIFRTDSITYIKGNMAVSEDEFSAVYFGGMNKSPLRKAWEEMDRIAKLISPEVVYLKQ